MRIIISYDITNNKLRADFNKYIKKYGHNLQYSVYEIENGTRILNNMLLEIDRLFKKRFAQTDSIYIFKLSSGCETIKYGCATNEDKSYLIF